MISIVTTVWGNKYTNFITAWWEAVAALDRQPDEVTFVTEFHCRMDYIEQSIGCCLMAAQVKRRSTCGNK